MARLEALTTATDVDDHFDREKARNEKQREVDEAQQLLHAAEAKVRADDPDISDADVQSHATVEPIREQLFGDGTSDGFIKELADANAALGVNSYQELYDAEVELDRLKGELELATKELLEDDPEADPATHPDLASARTAVSDQETLVETKLTELKATSWYHVEEMEIAVPEYIWDNFRKLLDTRRTLEKLDNLPADLNDLKDAVETAEDALVTSLEEEDASRRGIESLGREIGQLAGRIERLSNRRQSQLFDASRGID